MCQPWHYTASFHLYCSSYKVLLDKKMLPREPKVVSCWLVAGIENQSFWIWKPDLTPQSDLHILSLLAAQFGVWQGVAVWGQCVSTSYFRWKSWLSFKLCLFITLKPFRNFFRFYILCAILPVKSDSWL